MMVTLAVVGVLLATIPAVMFAVNLPLFGLTMADQTGLERRGDNCKVSVLIPARDEASAIGNSVSAALASRNVDVEVVVLDDHSTDETREVVRAMSKNDSRVRLVEGKPLPDGWNGKQHACWQLASAATHDRMVFLDADVRLSPLALSILVARQDRTDTDLLSAFPHQETGTWLEKWIIPMMHFVLLGYLPLARMRASDHPSYAAGCGQLFMTTKSKYRIAGSHEAIQSSRHDGLKLPRAYRHAELSTDVIDGTELAECRMYTNASEVVRGVLKNAIEGIANPRLIVPFTILLIGSSVLPVVTLIASMITGNAVATVLSMIGVVVGHLPRAIASKVFRQPIAGVIFHSAATLVFVVLQWCALWNHCRGRQVAWRGRIETAERQTAG